MNIIKNINVENWQDLLTRPTKKSEDLESLVKEIFEEVRNNKDKAIQKYTKKFDKVTITNLLVNNAEIQNAITAVSDDLIAAMELAKKNITKFHESQINKKQIIETSNGVECWQEMRPIEKVGLYIPGGTAPLFSTILMLAIPAKLAGCKEVILCTPPDKDGNIHPAILAAAHLVGITSIFKTGGIQAIAGMTYGTETIPQTLKIFGPGNQYVTSAKQYALTQGIAIDMPAGPSELLVLADKNANPTFVASDLLSQAEHLTDNQVICIGEDEDTLNMVVTEINKQLEELPRKEIATKALINSKIILISSIEDQINFINQYAPEHLILNVIDECIYLDKITNAGSVFIGQFTPESAGDYASGTNHTLPTNGYAKMYSGVNMDAFTKKITFQKISQKGIQEIGPAIEIMAEAEGLQAHKNAVTLRLVQSQPH